VVHYRFGRGELLIAGVDCLETATSDLTSDVGRLPEWEIDPAQMFDGALCRKTKHPEQVVHWLSTPEIVLPRTEKADCQARQKL
jgi:hypothetical protein